ncbi:unnamed protein product [Protopolystoma xenopodis]|uniref:Uncharacterized protein n=1 Tax=Protopolystoma xenopodis TaxID=117903 RepID=A0A3S4ZKC9_9PLAT|nr:unnamed protein product [Protopolystoma xenopodis]
MANDSGLYSATSCSSGNHSSYESSLPPGYSFLARLLREDIAACLEFADDRLLDAIYSGLSTASLELEPIKCASVQNFTQKPIIKSFLGPPKCMLN